MRFSTVASLSPDSSVKQIPAMVKKQKKQGALAKNNMR
jgi:hypothetical protein